MLLLLTLTIDLGTSDENCSEEICKCTKNPLTFASDVLCSSHFCNGKLIWGCSTKFQVKFDACNHFQFGLR